MKKGAPPTSLSDSLFAKQPSRQLKNWVNEYKRIQKHVLSEWATQLQKKVHTKATENWSQCLVSHWKRMKYFIHLLAFFYESFSRLFFLFLCVSPILSFIASRTSFDDWEMMVKFPVIAVFSCHWLLLSLLIMQLVFEFDLSMYVLKYYFSCE